jgi:hypothetical protein
MEKNRIDGRKMGEYDKNKENRKNYWILIHGKEQDWWGENGGIW